MSAPSGGGGGRRLPLYIDILTTGQAQAIGALNQVGAAAANMGRGMQGAAGPANQAQQSLRQTGQAAGQATQGLNQVAQGAQRTGQAMAGVQRSAQQTARGFDQMSTAGARTASGFNTINSGLNRVDGAMQNFNSSMSRGAALRTAFVENMRGMAFGAVGLFGAVNEAAFMIENFSLSNQRLAEAQAEVNRLNGEGQKGTKEYASAMKELEQATRAANFTKRIMIQSIFDIVSFFGFLASNLTNVVQRYGQLRTATDAATASNKAFAMSIQQANASQIAQIGNFTRFGNTAAAAGTAAAGAAAGVGRLGGAFQNTTVNLGGSTSKVKEFANGITLVGPAAGGAGRGLLGMLAIAGKVALVIAAVVGVIIALEKNFMGIRDAARGFVNWIKDIVSHVPGAVDVINALVGAYKYLAGAVTGVIGKIPFIGEALGLQQKAAEGAATGTQGLTKAQEEHNEAIAELSPSIQDVAKAWGVYDAAQAASVAGSDRMLERLQEMNKIALENRPIMEDLAIANGKTAVEAYGMSHDALVQYLAGLDEVKPTAEMAAEAAAAAAQKMADEWQASFDRISEATDAWGQTMLSASETIWGEMGGKMKVGLNDIKQEVQGGFGFNVDFWEKLFPQQIADNVFRKNFDIPELIDDMKDTINRAVDKGFIEEEQAKKWFDPLMSYMENQLPDDAEAAMGQLVGIMPGLMAELQPSLINGVLEVGRETKNAVDTGIVQPIVQGLQGLDQGTSGLQFGQNILGIVEQSLPAMRALGTEGEALAGVFQGILDSSLPMYDTTEEKVQAVIQVLGQMGMGFDSLIMGVNQDADEFADIMDNQILDAANQARLGMLLFERDMARIAGDTGKEWALTQIIDDIIGQTEQLTDVQKDLQTAFGGTAQEVQHLTEAFDGVNAAGEGIKLDEQWKEAIDNATGDTKQWLIDTYEEITGHDLFEDGVEIPINPSVKKEKNKQQFLDDVKNAVGTDSLTSVLQGGDFGFGPIPKDKKTPGQIITEWMADDNAPAKPAENPMLKQFETMITEAIKALPQLFGKTLPGMAAAIAPELYNQMVLAGQGLYDAITKGFPPLFTAGWNYLVHTVGPSVVGVLTQIGTHLYNGLIMAGQFLYDAITKGLPPLLTAGWNYLVHTVGPQVVPVLTQIGTHLYNGLIMAGQFLYDAITKGLPPLLTSGWNFLVHTVGPHVVPVLTQIGTHLYNGLIMAGQGLYDAITKGLPPLLTSGWNYLVHTVGPQVVPVLTQIGRHLYNGLIMAGQWLYDAITKGLPPLLTAGWNYLVHTVGPQVVPVLTQIGTHLYNGLIMAGQWLYDAITKGLPPLLTAGWNFLVHTVGPQVVPVLTQIGTHLYNGLIMAGQFLYDAITKGLPPLLTAGWNYLVHTIGPQVVPTLTLIGQHLYNGIVLAGQGLYDGIVALGALLQPGFNLVVTQGGPIVVAALGQLSKYIIDGMVVAIGNAGVWLKTNAPTIAATIRNAFTEAAKHLPGMIGAAMGTMAGTLAKHIVIGLAAATTDLPAKIEAWLSTSAEILQGVKDGIILLFSNPDAMPTPEEVGGAVEEHVVGFAEAFGQAFVDAFGPEGVAAAEQLSSNIQQIADGIFAWIKGGVDKAITDMFTFIRTTNPLQAIAAAFGVKEKIDITQLTARIVESLKQAVNDAVTQVKTWAESHPILGPILDALAKIGAYTPDAPPAPAPAPTPPPNSNTTYGNPENMLPQSGRGEGQLYYTSGGNRRTNPAYTKTFGQSTAVGARDSGLTTGSFIEGQQDPNQAGGIDAFIQQLEALRAKVVEVVGQVTTLVPQMELAWTNHLANTGAQIMAFGAGALTQLATAYQLMAAAIPPIIATMELAWTNHLANTAAQIMVFGQTALTPLATAYQLMAAAIPPIIATMELAWTNHLANTAAQIMVFGQTALTPLATAYQLFQTIVVPIIQAMELAWTNHLANTGAQIIAFGQTALAPLATAYDIFNTVAIPIINAMELAWTMHIQNNTAQILAFINTLAGLQQMYITMQFLTGVIADIERAWTSHLGNNTQQINTFVTEALQQYIDAHVQLGTDVHAALEGANQHWAAHVDHVAGLIGDMISHVEELASAIEANMSAIASSMDQATSAAQSLKSAIDALESKTITITTVFRTVGSPGGGGGRQSAQYGFEGIVRQPTRFLVGEGNKPEFVSVTPLVGRNARGNSDVRGYFDNLKSDNTRRKTLERAGTGGIGSSVSGLPRGPQDSGLKRPDIRVGEDRRKTTMNVFFEDVLTYGEQKEYRDLLKKLKKKKWKPSKLKDEDEDRLYELEDKILQARQQQIESIKSAMANVEKQINLTTDLASEAELEKWVSTVMPPLSSAPLSMTASSVKAMSIRGRYEHHREHMKAGRRDTINWMAAEYDRQIALAEKLEEERIKKEKEKEDYLLEHGTKKQKKAIEKKRKKEKEEQRRKLMLSRAERRDFAYHYSIDKYYDTLANQIPPPERIPAPVPGESPSDSRLPANEIEAARGFSGIVRRRTNFTVGEHGRAEQIDITPLGQKYKERANEIRDEVRHFITGAIGGIGGAPGGNRQVNRQVIVVQNNQPIELKISEETLARAVNRSVHKSLSGKR